jgi:heterotetrameric sarcosine oxidase gamma subunit
VPRSAIADIAPSPTTGNGVIVSDRDGLGLATALARKARAAALAERIRDRFGIDLPKGPHRAVVRDTAFAGTGPAAWLAMREQGGNAFAASLKETIGDLASVTDQSDGYAVLRLGGPKLRETLAKIVSTTSTRAYSNRAMSR